MCKKNLVNQIKAIQGILSPTGVFTISNDDKKFLTVLSWIKK